jgi:hypothetical protein
MTESLAVPSQNHETMNILFATIDYLDSKEFPPVPDNCLSNKQKREVTLNINLLLDFHYPTNAIAVKHKELGMTIDFEKEGINFDMPWYLEKNFLEQTLEAHDKYVWDNA